MFQYPVIQLMLQFCYIGDTGAEILAKNYPNGKGTAHSQELLDLRYNDFTAIGIVHVMKIVMTSEPHYYIAIR